MTRYAKYWGVLAGAAMIGCSAPVFASDALIEGAKQCTQYFPVKERQYGIPVHLLAAISSIETGRYHKGLGMALPWPWTINVEGKGYFFATKEEAVAETSRHLRMGKRSIDIGCMQVNLKHHPNAFANLSEAFDPEKNVDYAARFLRNNYSDLGNNWVRAAAAYHSRTPSRGNPYLQKVAVAWKNIVTKVQQAQANTGQQPMQVASNDPGFAAAAQSAPAAKPMNRIEATRNVKVISVTPQATPAQVVVVNTPASYTPTANAPQAMPVAAQPPRAHAVEPRRVAVEERGAGQRGPNFVFSN